jgi:hypothetical protein
LPLGDASVCSENMGAPGEKFCVLEYYTIKSVVTVQRAFRAEYVKDPPTDKTVHAWYKQLTESWPLYRAFFHNPVKENQLMLKGVVQTGKHSSADGHTERTIAYIHPKRRLKLE